MPPFPRRRTTTFSAVSTQSAGSRDGTLIDALRMARVGGTFWGAQPSLPAGRDLILAPASPTQADDMLAQATAKGLLGRAILLAASASGPAADLPRLSPGADPWHLAHQATAIWADANDELALVAALTGTPLVTFGTGIFARLSSEDADAAALGDLVTQEILDRTAYADPFSGAESHARSAIALLAEWRRLIDDNRPIAAIVGVASWKRQTVDPLLWDGGGPPRYQSARQARDGLKPGDTVLAWKARIPASLTGLLDRSTLTVGEIEDGFIRSSGLGANCVPPLSIAVDRLGAHFDPAQPSALEELLQRARIDPALVERAAALRQWLVREGLSKYGVGTARIDRPGGSRRHILVAGQVEDDRSIIHGGGGVTNLDLLRRARALEPDAYLIYKPHPDVEAGHRKGLISDTDAHALADRIERDAPIAALLDSVDAVHVITSLAGFEGLMRGKAVTTHGVPFFAGWGLTRDLGQVPTRRTTRRSLDELVAAALILYPRYVDPVTRLPCPVEVLVDRMVKGQAAMITPRVRLRQLEGKIRAYFQKLRSRIGAVA